MFSFINMGGRRKRRRSKRGRSGTVSGQHVHKHSPRSSGSFLSPGDVLAIEEPSEKLDNVHPFARAEGKQPLQVQYSSQRSPAIELEFKHDSLLKTMPRDFLRYRNGSASGSSLDELTNSPQSRSRRIQRMASVTPIQIPTVSLSSVSVQRQFQNENAGPSSNLTVQTPGASLAPHSPAWNSDTEDMDPVSAVSGISVACDAIGKSFTFSARPSAGFQEGVTPSRDLGHRMTRQDSATLPSDFNWLNAAPLTSSTQRHRSVERRKSLERKKSTRSLKRERRDVGVDEQVAAVGSTHVPEDDDKVFDASLQRRPSGPRARTSIGIPPTATPSTLKLDSSDQAGLHRISRIVENDGETSVMLVPTPEHSAASKSSGKRTPISPPLHSLNSKTSLPSVYSSSSPRADENQGHDNVRKSSMDYESFWEDFQFVSPTTRREQSHQRGYSQTTLPMTATTTRSGSISASSPASGFAHGSQPNSGSTAAYSYISGPISGSGSGSASGTAVSPGYTFPPSSSVSSPGQSSLAASSRGKHGITKQSSVQSDLGRSSVKDNNINSPGNAFGSPFGPSDSAISLSPMSIPSPPTTNVSSSSLSSQASHRSRGTSIRHKVSSGRGSSASSAASSVTASPVLNRTKPVPLNVIAVKNNLSQTKDINVPVSVLPIGEKSSPMHRSFQPPTPDIEKRRPSLPHLQLDQASPNKEAVSPSVRSPDLLDMLIPNGYVVTHISGRHVGRKRSGSTPNPVTIRSGSRRVPYPTVKECDDAEEADGTEVEFVQRKMDEKDVTPGTGQFLHAQTFPETPEAFSPYLFSPDFPQDVSPPSTGNGIISRHASSSSKFRPSRRIGSIPLQPIIIPASPLEVRISRKSRSPENPTPAQKKALDSPTKGAHSEAATPSSGSGDQRTRSILSASSPPISPLQPPPTPPPSLPPSPENIQIPISYTSPPISLAPAPRKKSAHSRPPLPFGPRKPTQAPLNFSLLQTPPLDFSRKNRSASEGTTITPTYRHSPAHSPFLAPKASAPAFKTTPVRWRGLTLEAAKWKFTTNELQTIVKKVIEQTSFSTSIRLLSIDELEKELPQALGKLESRKQDIQWNYRLSVRKREAYLQRLKTIPSGAKADAAVVVRFAEELADVSSTCDKLADELHEVMDQIAQINKLLDNHSTSALGMALRKLNSSLIRQMTDARDLQRQVESLRAEKEVAWNKAEEIGRDLDDMAEQMEGTDEAKKRASMRSNASTMSRKSSVRASRALFRMSGYRRSYRSSGSSLKVNPSASCRTTFSSDVIPPVPPLPSQEIMVVNKGPLSQGSAAISPGPPTSSEALYRTVFDMLGVDRDGQDQTCTSRPQSALLAMHTSEETTQSYTQSMASSISSRHSRTNSLPTIAPHKRQASIQDPALIVAMLGLDNKF